MDHGHIMAWHDITELSWALSAHHQLSSPTQFNCSNQRRVDTLILTIRQSKPCNTHLWLYNHLAIVPKCRLPRFLIRLLPPRTATLSANNRIMELLNDDTAHGAADASRNQIRHMASDQNSDWELKDQWKHLENPLLYLTMYRYSGKWKQLICGPSYVRYSYFLHRAVAGNQFPSFDSLTAPLLSIMSTMCQSGWANMPTICSKVESPGFPSLSS
jgi:hypothetical protein